MEKIKQKLVGIYRNKLNRIFYAHDNPAEWNFMKYLLTLLNINLIHIMNHWGRKYSYLDMKYKTMLAISYKLTKFILDQVGLFKALNLVNEFSDRIDKFVVVLNDENSKKNVIDKSSEHSQIDKDFEVSNQIIRVVIEKLNRAFRTVLKDAEFLEKFEIIYKNIVAYSDMFEREVLMLEETI
ncbi:MAG: hypothetical protein ACRC5G_05100 [Cetobacterium sp.]